MVLYVNGVFFLTLRAKKNTQRVKSAPCITRAHIISCRPIALPFRSAQALVLPNIEQTQRLLQILLLHCRAMLTGWERACAHIVGIALERGGDCLRQVGVTSGVAWQKIGVCAE